MHHLFVTLADTSIRINPQGILPTSTPDVGVALQRILKTIVVIIGLVSIIVMIYGGLRIALSAGNPAQVKIGRDTVTYAAVGIIVALSAFAIVTLVTSIG